MPSPLDPQQLYTPCAFASSPPFASTEELEDLPHIPGQTRAAEAVALALAMAAEGFNLFVMGPPGTGRRSLVLDMVAQAAAGRPVPPDWVYVHNFAQPHKPRAIQLPAGRGRVFKADMQRLVEDLLAAIPAIFESDEYRNRLEEIEQEFAEREHAAFRAVGEQAEREGIALLRTPGGFGLAPVRDGEVLGPEEFDKLPEHEKARIRAAIERLHGELHKVIRQAPQWLREKRERVRELNREFSRLAVEHQIGELKDKYRDLPAVLAHLQAVEQDLIDSAEEFRKPAEAPPQVLGLPLAVAPAFRRYQVNLLVDHGDTRGAPVVEPDHPNHAALVGRVEHIEHLGALVTDFSLIKAGALHQASGGFLVLDAHRLLTQPYAWEGLKRALRARRVRPDSLAQLLSLASTIALEPEPIPLEVKVVLVGERLLYYLLAEFDPDFPELFKVVADFEDELPRTPQSAFEYARLIATLARRERLLPFAAEACARLEEQAARAAGDAERLSTHIEGLLDLMREADFLARQAGEPRVTRAQVQAVVAARERRSGRLRERVQDGILRGTVHIETSGQMTGQVNGLSVIDLGTTRFAHPTRITANVRLGEGEVIDIHREVELGGAIHSKGVMILASFLATRYASSLPLSLTAALTFEQTYGQVEGDSASMAELCALLSALALLPIKQALAVTGSVDQHGHAQAIGAVNEKIEGFYDICARRGLTGEQGVIIPATNVKHLMLREDVVAACAAGRFHVWPVRHVDEAIELLTGVPAGAPDDQGVVPEGTVNYRVAARLIEFSSLRQAYAGHGEGKARRRNRGRT
ncbi:MAG: AAA family ATPase [Thiobacillaceae bacterium]|nr:AAA family ATPase [Thiobacillaceae bacterium]MDW8324545.1 ATP-binding protein [Burkholderiales bacterium]